MYWKNYKQLMKWNLDCSKADDFLFLCVTNYSQPMCHKQFILSKQSNLRIACP